MEPGMLGIKSGQACPTRQKLLLFSLRMPPGPVYAIGHSCQKQDKQDDQSRRKRHGTVCGMFIWDRASHRFFVFCAFVLVVQLPGQLGATGAHQALQFHLAHVDGYGWQIKDLRIRVALSSASTAHFRLSIASLTL